MVKIIKPTKLEVEQLEADKQTEAYDKRLQYFIDKIREAVEKCEADPYKEIEMHVVNKESADVVEEILFHVRKETPAANQIKVVQVTVH
jgi:predicted transcriptional regulator